MHAVLETIGKTGVVPVVTLRVADEGVPVCRALLDGGIPIAEVTFRTSAGLEAIGRLSRELPELIVGAGTVITREQAAAALKSGAKFVVSPGFNPKVVELCQSAGVPVIPGCSSPTDLTMAVEHGIDVVKFFPADALGGLRTLKALAAPFGGLCFIPTGGVDPANLREYLGFSKVIACGGSWMVKPEVLEARDYAKITSASRNSVGIVRELRDIERAVKG